MNTWTILLLYYLLLDYIIIIIIINTITIIHKIINKNLSQNYKKNIPKGSIYNWYILYNNNNNFIEKIMYIFHTLIHIYIYIWRVRLTFFFKMIISFWLLCICFYVSTGTSEWVEAGIECIWSELNLCVESIHSVLLSHFWPRWTFRDFCIGTLHTYIQYVCMYHYM